MRRAARLLLALGLMGCAGLDAVLPPASPLPPTATATLTETIQPSSTLSSTVTQTPSSTPRPAPERVVVFSLDGLRPDALSPDRTPVIMGLAARGASSWSAQTILPSATLMGHGSMLSGYEVEDHGLIWNDYIPSRGYIQTPTLFTLAHDAGLETVMVVSKPKLEHIAVPGSVDRFVVDYGGDFSVAAAAVAQVEQGFDVLFVHFPGPDAAGHVYGWMSPTYLGTVVHTDEAVGRVLEAIAAQGWLETTLVVLTADHGGHGMLHGSSAPEDMTIPWVIAGPGVVPGLALASPVRVFDTAATVLWALGIARPPDMDGTPVLEAFGVTETTGD
ncbi:MAG TPA: alkaline phosphatase family protein [Anaerolineales bacterium]|nr:alkaline phosphatase family protein [Anaerolineales bacterium]